MWYIFNVYVASETKYWILGIRSWNFLKIFSPLIESHPKTSVSSSIEIQHLRRDTIKLYLRTGINGRRVSTAKPREYKLVRFHRLKGNWKISNGNTTKVVWCFHTPIISYQRSEYVIQIIYAYPNLCHGYKINLSLHEISSLSSVDRSDDKCSVRIFPKLFRSWGEKNSGDVRKLHCSGLNGEANERKLICYHFDVFSNFLPYYFCVRNERVNYYCAWLKCSGIIILENGRVSIMQIA